METKYENSKAVDIAAVILQLIIYGLPAALCALPFYFLENMALQIALILLVPLEYAFLFGAIAGLLSMPFQKGIVKGVFPRKTGHPVYAMRKLYGTCWTAVYYFKPIYNIILSIPLLKRIVFRLFGYKGSLKIAIYPDAWIRDLTLLNFEDGAYVSNRATIGTNICLIDGNIIVGKVTLKKNAVVGHLSMLAPDVEIGENSEIGVGCEIGLHTIIGNNSSVDPGCLVGHRVKIGNDTKIGLRSYVGTGAKLGNNLLIPSYACIPDGAKVLTQEDVNNFIQTLSPVHKVVYQPVFENIKERKPH